MVGWEAALVEVGVVHGVLAVFLGVVADEGVAEEDALEDALGLGEGVAGAEGPAGAEFPLALLAEGVGGEEVDGVAAVVVGVVGLHLVGALDVAEGVGGPEVEAFEVDACAEVEACGEALLDDVVLAEVFGFEVGAGGEGVVGGAAVVVDFVAVGVEDLVEAFVVKFGVEGDV